MSAVSIIVDIVLILVSILLIVTVLMQQGQRQGLGAIGGGAETFFGKNKAKSYEGKLATLTKVSAVIFIILAIIATIVIGNDDNATADPTAPAVTATAEPTADAEATPEAEATAEAAETTATAEATAEAEATPTATAAN